MWQELGDCYLYGNGVGKDIDEAIKCYELGVQRSQCNFCRMRLGTLYSDESSGYYNRKLAEEYLLPITNDDRLRASAAFKLGVLFDNAGDKQGAVRWFMMAAKENHVNAQYNLGVIFFNGDLGARDLDAAEQYFTMAAQNGHPTAASDAADCRKLKAQGQSQFQQSGQNNGN